MDRLLEHSAPPPNKFVLIVAISLAALLFLATAWRASAPPPNMDVDPETTNGTRFSARKAHDTLSYLLKDGVPHTMGTGANRRVKERVIEKLRETGAAVEEQHALACAQSSPHCGFVENVIGTLPGSTDDSIVLMAHYDSTTSSPGAGDDGAGVAAIIETLRILAAEAERQGRSYRNTIQAVITDGEEDGLFGAEAFFADHPDAGKVGTLINVEGSGTAGPSNLLRSSPGSGSLVTLYRRTAPHPMASSIATEIFKRMPNDTDFSVGIRAGVKGLDFAFAGERTHYHSPLDTVENLELSTLQHHGDNILPLLRELVDVDLGTIEGEYSYTTMFDLWLQWRESLSLPLACLATLLLLIGMVLRRKSATLLSTLVSILATFVVLAVTIVSCIAALTVADRLAGGTPGWPGTIWPWRLILLSASAAGLSLVGAPVARRLGFHSTLNGVWFWIAVMAVLAAAAAPLAASPFLVPLLVMAILSLGLTLVDRSGVSPMWLAVAIAGALSGVVYLAGLIPLLEETQGYQLAPAFYVPLAFSLLLFTPLFAVSYESSEGEDPSRNKRQASLLLVFSGVGLIAAAIGLESTPLFTEQRPQALSLRYVQDLDQETAKWWLLGSPPLPHRLTDLASFEFQDEIMPGLPNSGLVALAAYEPWRSAVAERDRTAPESEEPGATDQLADARPETFQIVGERTIDGIREVTVRLQSLRQSTLLRLAVHPGADLQTVRIAGREALNIRPRGERFDLISIYAPPSGGVEVVLGLGSAERHEHVVMDIALELPTLAAPLLEARAPLARPVHSGDRWMAFERISF